MDGPVVRAAMQALVAGNVNVVLPWVYPGGEGEVRDAFARAQRARAAGGEAAKVGEQWFFETVVRVHRRGEGSAFEGVKPAGLDPGPVIPHAERAVETGDIEPVARLLADELREGLTHRLHAVLATRSHDVDDVRAARAHVNAVLDLELYAHHVHEALTSRHAHDAPAKAPQQAHAH